MIHKIGVSISVLECILWWWLWWGFTSPAMQSTVSTTNKFTNSFNNNISNQESQIICQELPITTITNLFQFNSCIYFSSKELSKNVMLNHYCPVSSNLPDQHQSIEKLLQPQLNKNKSIALVQFPVGSSSPSPVSTVLMLFSNGLYQHSLIQTNSSTLVSLSSHELDKHLEQQQNKQRYLLLKNFLKSQSINLRQINSTDNTNNNQIKIKSIAFNTETNDFYVILEQSIQIIVVNSQSGKIQSYHLYWSPNNVQILPNSNVDNNNNTNNNNNSSSDINIDADKRHNQKPIDSILFVQRKLFVLIDTDIYKVWIFSFPNKKANNNNQSTNYYFEIIEKYSLKDFFNCNQNSPFMPISDKPKTDLDLESLAPTQSNIEKSKRKSFNSIFYILGFLFCCILAFVLIVSLHETRKYLKNKKYNRSYSIDEDDELEKSNDSISSRYKSDLFNKSLPSYRKKRKRTKNRRKSFLKKFPTFWRNSKTQSEESDNSSGDTSSPMSISLLLKDNNQLFQFRSTPLLTISRQKDSLIKFANQGKLSAELKTIRLVKTRRTSKLSSVTSLELAQSPAGSIRSELSIGLDDKCSLGYYSAKAPLPGGFKHRF